MTSSSPPLPVSSLRSRFEQIAAASSSHERPLSVPRQSASPAPDPRQGQFDSSGVVSADTSVTLGVPLLRASPSSPELRSPEKTRPPPPAPRGSRTPSPQPPRQREYSQPDSPTATSSPAQPDFTKPSSLPRRRPPPPPPPKPSSVVAPESVGGVASLRSKFTAGPPRNNAPRSVSATVSLPLLVRANGGTTSSQAKGPRASLPSLTSSAGDPVPTRLNSLLHSDTTHALTRSPPPVPSRNSVESFTKGMISVKPDGAQYEEERPTVDTPLSSGESTSASEDDAPQPPKPRIPPRPRMSTYSTPVVPPPLPPRRSASDEAEEQMATAPPLPQRHSSDPSSAQVTSKPPSRLDGIPPPPTRSIGLKDKLPPARRPSTDSDESEGEQLPGEQPSVTTSRLARTLEDLPDSTHCSRRLPILPDYKFAKVHVHIAAASCVAVSGPHVVVASHHHLRTYDMSISESPVSTIEFKDLPIEWRVKDPRVTALEFRAGKDEEAGRFLWCGSKDGHLLEFDVRECAVTRVRTAVHNHAVTHIMRHGASMVTIDESGKAFVWKDHEDIAGRQPRIVRVTEKQGFAKMFNGLLWTSSGPGNSGTGNGATRTPIVRVYDILSSSSTAAKVITPPEALGAVTSGTILPSQPNCVYLGHEGGYVTGWSVSSSSETVDRFDTGSVVPTCVQIVRISASDVLSIEGVVDKLWIGVRKGTVSVYDVKTKPWTMTNSWQAHGELPVLKLVVDPFSIDKCHRMHVLSVGRDETLRFWDGLLGADWVDGELQKREASFSAFRNVNVLICSWNTDAQKPEALTGSYENINFLETVLRSVDGPDVIVFGFQELIDLENRKLTAKTVLLGNQKKNTDGSISDKVSRSYRMWHERLVQAVQTVMPVDEPYVVAHTENLVGLFTCIFVRQRQRHLLRDPWISTIKRGMGGIYGNKGAIVARFVIDDSSLCFVNCHLAAGQSHTRSRNQDLAVILEDAAALPRSEVPEALPYVGGGDGTMILDHEVCFLCGDLNYRIDQRRDVILSAISSGDLDFLLHHDQLRKQAKTDPKFRLRDFVEPPISFAPTYKYDRRSDMYDSSEKSRAPAWCDRVLYYCRDPSHVQTLHYRRYEANVSDHRPISAAFRVTVKSIRQEARAVEKAQVELRWQEYSLRLLMDVREFYATQQVL